MEDTAVNFCQSCGMPMSDESMYGDNADGGKNGDYCKYCWKEGKFTSDSTMEEMMEICVPFEMKACPDMSEEQIRERMKKFFPTLKRWK